MFFVVNKPDLNDWFDFIKVFSQHAANLTKRGFAGKIINTMLFGVREWGRLLSCIFSMGK